MVSGRITFHSILIQQECLEGLCHPFQGKQNKMESIFVLVPIILLSLKQAKDELQINKT